MNDGDASKQIQQMVEFIRQEAQDKAKEIAVASDEEFNIEKMQLVEAEKKKIRQDYERKEKQVDIRKKIEYSTQLNASRLKFLQAQDDEVTAMKDSAAKELLRVSSDHKTDYKKIIKFLIVESLVRLNEPSMLVRCREIDLKLVKSVLDEARNEYAKKAKVNPPIVSIDNVFLPPAPTLNQLSHEAYCSGGVVLASQDGKIVCENTLDARLDVAFRQKLPQIRKRMFAV